MIQSKTDKELQEQLCEVLKCYSNMNEHFRSMLLRRARRGDWLECPLVRIILKRAEQNLEMIEKRLKTISDFNSQLSSFPKGLLGDEKDFDAQLTDHLAELHGAERLIENGFSEIERIQTGQSKTPDFKAKKQDLLYLIEVKNFRHPLELMNLVLDKSEARKLKYSDSYGQWDFRFELDSELRFRNANDEVVPDTKEFFDRLDKFVFNSSTSTCENTVEFDGIKCICTRTTPSSGSAWAYYGRGVCVSDPRYIFDRLMPLVKKTCEKLDRAAVQLCDFDKSDNCQKVIMINWMKPDCFRINDSLERTYGEIVKEFDKLLKMVNPKLGVWLL